MKRGAWDIPDHVIDALAACFLPDIVKFVESEKRERSKDGMSDDVLGGNVYGDQLQETMENAD